MGYRWVGVMGSRRGGNYHIEQSSVRRGSGGSIIVCCMESSSVSFVVMQCNEMR